jgi:hypothetical protein
LTCTRNIVRSIEKRHWKNAQRCLLNQAGTDSLSWKLSVALIAEGLRISPSLEKGGCGGCLLLGHQYAYEMLEILKNVMTYDTAECMAYLFSCLGLCLPSKDIREETVRGLSQCYAKGHNVFKTPLCTFAALLEPRELSDFLGDLCKTKIDHQASVVAANVTIYHSLLLMLDEPDKIEVISSHSTSFLSLSLELLAWSVAVSPECGDFTMIASSLIVDVASRKNVATIRERDVALFLSAVTAPLQKCSSLDEKDLPRYGIKAFEACYFLVSFFLQRFSKQAQNCLSCLFRSLMSMMEFVLYAPLTDIALVESGQRWNRLCELLLPHAEVYKKHVLSLIVHFVKGFVENVDVIRKKSLLNGIHCLLDIIQEHETKQLNSMLDDTGRSLLLSVYEGYKKHAYKGQ